MRIAYNNFIDPLTSTSIIASSEDTSYLITNVQDQRLTTKWYSDDSTTHTVVVDLGSARDCSVFAIMGHNCSSTGTVVVNGNDDILPNLVWTTSGQSSTQTITYNANMMLLFVSPITNRYWQFTFTGQDQNGLQVGRLWIGDYITITPSSLNDFTVEKVRDDVVVYGRNRQKYASIGNEWRRFKLSFPKTSSTALTAIQTMYDTVGNHTSFIFCNFDSLRTYELVEPCYCSINGNMTFTHSTRQYYTYSLALEEDR